MHPRSFGFRCIYGYFCLRFFPQFQEFGFKDLAVDVLNIATILLMLILCCYVGNIFADSNDEEA
jgi:hypothetical protein